MGQTKTKDPAGFLSKGKKKQNLRTRTSFLNNNTEQWGFLRLLRSYYTWIETEEKTSYSMPSFA